MTATAVQLPPVDAPARHAGGRLFRKQILPGPVVDHPQHGRVQLDVAGIMERFEAGALDVVPFTLVDAANCHNDEIDRVRGTVKRLEREGDELYAVIEASDRGAALIAEQPRLPVSVRVKVPESGDFAGQQVLAHVAGTLDPVVTGMRAWEPVEASNAVVLDFSAGEFLTGDDVSEAVEELIAEALAHEESDPPISLEAAADEQACEEGFELAYQAALEGQPMELAKRITEVHERHELLEAWGAAHEGRPVKPRKVELAEERLSPDERAAREAAQRWIESDL